MAQPPATKVFTKACAATPFAAKAPAGLSPSQPNHSRPRPIAIRGMLLGFSSSHVLVAHQPAVEEGEAWRHDRDQGGSEQDERCVAGVDVAHAGFPPR
jgi:hypothetical protein